MNILNVDDVIICLLCPIEIVVVNSDGITQIANVMSFVKALELFTRFIVFTN